VLRPGNHVKPQRLETLAHRRRRAYHRSSKRVHDGDPNPSRLTPRASWTGAFRPSCRLALRQASAPGVARRSVRPAQEAHQPGRTPDSETKSANPSPAWLSGHGRGRPPHLPLRWA
jgi:hypothetical protein